MREPCLIVYGVPHSSGGAINPHETPSMFFVVVLSVARQASGRMAKRGRNRRRSRKRINALVMNPEHARWITDTAREAAELNEERRGKVARSEGELRMEKVGRVQIC